MKSILVILVCLVVVSQLVAARLLLSTEWSNFKLQHNKNYVDVKEEARRFNNFLATKALVERHNANQTNSYKMKVNHLADLSAAEFARMNGLRPPQVKSEMSNEQAAYLTELLASDDDNLPTRVDWREVNDRVSPVKDQGNCGSCWAFATTGLLEGQQIIKNVSKSLIPLSEQELVDCSINDSGCNGGFMATALEDIQSLGGIESETDYPYRHDDQKCKFDKKKAVMSDNGYILLNQDSEKDLIKAVAKYGPVATAMQATENLINYNNGVFKDVSCNEGDVNHGVLVVGYGTDPKDGDYWIVKNSWSKKWGEKGYFRLQRGVNMCQIASYPIIAKV